MIEAIDQWKLPYEFFDGIIIPKGVEAFDKALVSDVANWLHKCPSAHRSYLIALQQYANNDAPRDIADNLRKSLEAFLQEFSENSKNLDNNISEISIYLKNKGIGDEIRNMFTTMIRYYKTNNDKTAKHYDDTDKNSMNSYCIKQVCL